MFGRLKYILLLFFFHQGDKITVYGIRKQHIGCYRDQKARTLPYERLDDDAMTSDICASHCCSSLNDATFMGTESDHSQSFCEQRKEIPHPTDYQTSYCTECCDRINMAGATRGAGLGLECYCSNAPNNDSFVKTQLSECNTLCGGNSNEFCGGMFRLSLYSLDCSPDTTIGSDPSTTSDRSSVIPEMTTKSTVAAHSSATTSLAQFTLISSVVGNNSVCSCANCIPINNTNWTEEELKERLSWLWNVISINKKETNMYKATKISAYDPRKSSRNIGIVGVIVLFVPVIIVVAMDVQRICKG